MASRDTKQPNLLFILPDDQGAWAMGCAGNAEIRSPNLDRLAKEGIRFDNFFCTSPVCSPARASILTGRIPSQHGVHDFLHWQSDTGSGGLDRQVPADSVQFLASMPTYAEMLTDAGYDTCLSGKWHLGDGLQPRCGFQTWNPMPYGASDYFNVPVVKNGELAKYDSYASVLFTDNALEFLGRQVQEDRPFCLNVHSPHLTRRGDGSIIHSRYGMTTMTVAPSTRCPAMKNRCLEVSTRDRLMPKAAAGIWPVISPRSRVWIGISADSWTGSTSRI